MEPHRHPRALLSFPSPSPFPSGRRPQQRVLGRQAADVGAPHAAADDDLAEARGAEDLAEGADVVGRRAGPAGREQAVEAAGVEVGEGLGGGGAAGAEDVVLGRGEGS